MRNWTGRVLERGARQRAHGPTRIQQRADDSTTLLSDRVDDVLPCGFDRRSPDLYTPGDYLFL